VGYSIIDGNHTLMLSWDGSDWSIVDSPNPGTANEILTGVSCASSSWCVAVGATPSDTGNKPLVEAWDGSSWSVVGTGFGGIVYALAVSGTNLYVGGYFTNALGNRFGFGLA
jgi:hypothetical protein